jgi:hypothetical protein
MPAPAEFVEMAIGTLQGKAQAPAGKASRHAMAPGFVTPAPVRKTAPLKIPEGVATIKDPVVSVDAGDIGSEVDSMFGRVARPHELTERVVEVGHEPTVADFTEAVEAMDGVKESAEAARAIDQNADELRDAFAESLENGPAKGLPESKDLINEFKRQAESESLDVLEKLLKGVK